MIIIKYKDQNEAVTVAQTRKVNLGTLTIDSNMSYERSLALGHYFNKNIDTKYFESGRNCVVTLPDPNNEGQLVEYTFTLGDSIFCRPSKSRPSERRYEVLGKILGKGGQARAYAIKCTLIPQPEDGSLKYKSDPKKPRAVKAFTITNNRKTQLLPVGEVKFAKLAGDDLHYSEPVFSDLRKTDGYAFVLMHLAEGELLQDMLTKLWAGTINLSLDLLLQISINLLENLIKVHRAVIHRDIKPENIFINDTGKICIFDYALAIPNIALSCNETVGTAPYMSSEVFSGSYSEKVDDYAMGEVIGHVLKKIPLPTIQDCNLNDRTNVDKQIRRVLSDMTVSAALVIPRDVIDAQDQNGIAVHGALTHLVEDLLKSDPSKRESSVNALSKLHTLRAKQLGKARGLVTVDEAVSYEACYKAGRKCRTTSGFGILIEEVIKLKSENDVNAFVEGLGSALLSKKKSKQEVLDTIDTGLKEYTNARKKTGLDKAISCAKANLELCERFYVLYKSKDLYLNIMRIKKYLREANAFLLKNHATPENIDDLQRAANEIMNKTQSFIQTADSFIFNRLAALKVELQSFENRFVIGVHCRDIKSAARQLELAAERLEKIPSIGASDVTELTDRVMFFYDNTLAQLPEKMLAMRNELALLEANFSREVRDSGLHTKINKFEELCAEADTLENKKRIIFAFDELNGSFVKKTDKIRKLCHDKTQAHATLPGIITKLNAFLSTPYHPEQVHYLDLHVIKYRMMSAILNYIDATTPGLFSRLFKDRGCSERRCNDMAEIIALIENSKSVGSILTGIRQKCQKLERGLFGRSLLADNLLAVAKHYSENRPLSEVVMGPLGLM